MKYVPNEYQRDGFIHKLIIRYRGLYIYEKKDRASQRFVCYEIFKARVRRASKNKYYTQVEDSHRYPVDEDFGNNAFWGATEEGAWGKFKELRMKYYGI